MQHMKLYLFDNDVIITGANLNRDYFENRQDRYILLKGCSLLCDYFEGLIRLISSFSHTMDMSGSLLPAVVDRAEKYEFCRQGHIQLSAYTTHWVDKTKCQAGDTLIYPVLQMPHFRIRQDESFLLDLLKSTSIAS